MDSKKSLGLVGVLAVVALVAAVWMVARPSSVPSIPAGSAVESPAPPAASSHAEKIALQFYRNPAPVADVTMKDVDGRTISTASLKGKVVIVNFWATWCPPCRAEIPDLIKLQDKYKDKLVVLGISEDEIPADEVKAFVVAQKMNYPVVMTRPELAKIFRGVSALPT